MPEDVEVFIVVKCENDPDEYPSRELLIRVSKKIRKIPGVGKLYFTKRLGDIIAIASWERCDISKYEKEISQIDGVNTVKSKILVPLE